MKKLLLIVFIYVSTICMLCSQNSILLSFEAEESQGGSPVMLDSVYVKNLDKDCDTTVYGDNTNLLLYLISGVSIQSGNPGAAKVYPNPFNRGTRLQLNTKGQDELNMVLSDMQGKILYTSRIKVSDESHTFNIHTSEKYSLLSIHGKHRKETLTLINQSPGTVNAISLEMTGIGKTKQSKTDDEFIYEAGDELLFTGYSASYVPDTLYDSPSENTLYTFQLDGLPDPTIPEINTLHITQILHNSVTGGGNVIHDGWSQITFRGLCWSTDLEPTINDNYTIEGSGTGEFTSTMENLDTNTTYYARAYATNAIGTAYGEQMNFTSKSDIPCPGIPNVTHGGEVYETVLIGNQCWLKQNMNIGTIITNSQFPENNGVIEKWCYDDDPLNCAFFGGLYRWDEAMQYDTMPGSKGICPSGWHIPTDEEIIILEGTVDSQYSIDDPEWDGTTYRGYDAGYNLKSSEGWNSNGNGSDIYGFNGLPAGYKWANGGDYTQIEEVFHICSSSLISGVVVWLRDLRFNHSEITRWNQPPLGGSSVRCIYDETFSND